MFEITQDAYYAIHKYFNGEWYPLVDFIYFEWLSGLNAVTFEAACIGDTLSFAVNGKLLAEVTDDSISAGDYGFFAGTFDQGGNIISFDNLTVSQP